MGMSIFGKSCITNSYIDTAPNPDPSRWELKHVEEFQNAYVALIKYIDCTNFEGEKVLVFKGKYMGLPEYLDPHFSEYNNSPIARFIPTDEGIKLAYLIADNI